MGKIRDWINRDDGEYFQVGNTNINLYEIVGILLSVVALFLWHLNNKKILEISPFVIVATFAVAFVLSWVGIRKNKEKSRKMIFSEVINPWNALQSAYGTAASSHCKHLRFQSALIDGARFSACLNFAFEAEGICIKKIWPFSSISRSLPLLIPWADIKVKKTDYLTSFPYEIHLERVPEVDFRVRRSLGRRLMEVCESERNR